MKVVGPNSLAESGVRRAGGWWLAGGGLVAGHTRGLATDNHHLGLGWCRVPRVVPRTSGGAAYLAAQNGSAGYPTSLQRARFCAVTSRLVIPSDGLIAVP